MIQPTEADIGRRVIYDPGVKGLTKGHGVLVGLTGGPNDNWIEVLFDGQSGPLNVGSNLHWGGGCQSPRNPKAIDTHASYNTDAP